MKKFFACSLATLLMAVTSVSASSSEWITGEVNERVIAEILVKEAVNTATGGKSTIRFPQTTVEITPETVIAKKDMHCWNSWVYHSDGTKTPRFQCM